MHILGEHELSYMKPRAVVCNIGRGTAIDTSALAAALAAGRLGGAALDVVEEEPLPADAPSCGLGVGSAGGADASLPGGAVQPAGPDRADKDVASTLEEAVERTGCPLSRPLTAG